MDPDILLQRAQELLSCAEKCEKPDVKDKILQVAAEYIEMARMRQNKPR